MNILLIDDEPHFIEKFKKNHSDHFTVDGCDPIDFLEGIEDFQIDQYDAVVVDLMMPNIDGISLLKRIKNPLGDHTRGVPIFILSSSGQDSSRVMALQFGAFDFLSKEMSSDEIRLRILRSESGESEIIEGLQLDRENLGCLLGGDSIDLTKTEFRILATLMESSNQTCLRSNLIKKVWPDREVVKQTLNTHIFNLNDKLIKWTQQITIDRDEVVRFKPR